MDTDKTKDAAAKDKAAPEAADAKTTRLVVLVPVNVTIAPGIEVVTEAGKPPVNVQFKTCIPAACLGQLELSDAQLQAFRNHTQPGQLTFIDPGEKPVTIPLSLKGLDQALDSLAKK